MSNYPEVVYWLALIQESGLKLNVVKPIIQRWCIAEGRSLAEMFALSALEWEATFGLPPAETEQAVAATEKLAQQAQVLAQWQAEGIEVLSRTDPRYPRRFSHSLSPAKQPLLVWAQGALPLLNEASITMVGQETPDEETAHFLRELMHDLVAEEIGLVSGYGRGLDRAAFETMLATPAGRAVVVLPLGLKAFAQTTQRLEPALNSGQIVLVSPFAPDTPYQERLAEARNLLIDHLALTLLILHPNEEAQSRAEAALNRGLSVFVSLTDTASNRALIDQGALLLTDSGEVIEMVQQALIDTALLESNEEEADLVAPLTTAPPPLPPLPPSDPNDDYSLRFEEVEPIDSEAALEILSLGGEIPEVLRRRLKQDEDEAD
jgi:predicted Rossmann fold nucleotide-binding protein DprA/Smf involved in DNA uptake